MVVPAQDVLTSLMTNFTGITAGSTQLLTPYAGKALITLITLDIVIAVLIMLIEDVPLGQQIIRRTIKYGAFSYMVFFYKDIINAFGDSFVLIGLKAAGDTLTSTLFTDPSKITDLGFNMIMPLVRDMISPETSGSTDMQGIPVPNFLLGLPTMIMLGLAYILILFCFFAIAINIFVVYIEFAIITSIGLILVPFGVWDKTEFIFDKIKNSIVTYGIKFMTLAFVVSIALNIISSWQLPPHPTFDQALYVLVGMLAVTYLCHHAPTVAAGMASGGGGSMTGAALGGFAGAAANKATSVGTTVVGAKNNATGERVGIIPSLGRMTGITPKIQSAGTILLTLGSDLGNSFAQRFSNKDSQTSSDGSTGSTGSTSTNAATPTSGVSGINMQSTDTGQTSQSNPEINTGSTSNSNSAAKAADTTSTSGVYTTDTTGTTSTTTGGVSTSTPPGNVQPASTTKSVGSTATGTESNAAAINTSPSNNISSPSGSGTTSPSTTASTPNTAGKSVTGQTTSASTPATAPNTGMEYHRANNTSSVSTPSSPASATGNPSGIKLTPQQPPAMSPKGPPPIKLYDVRMPSSTPDTNPSSDLR